MTRPEPKMNTGDGITIESTSLNEDGGSIKWKHTKSDSGTYEVRILFDNRVVFHADALETQELDLNAADYRWIRQRVQGALSSSKADDLSLKVHVIAHREAPVEERPLRLTAQKTLNVKRHSKTRTKKD